MFEDYFAYPIIRIQYLNYRRNSAEGMKLFKEQGYRGHTNNMRNTQGYTKNCSTSRNNQI